MHLTNDEIEKIARLCRISISETERQKLAGELSAVLDYFQKLQGIDTSHVEARPSEAQNTNRTREDTPSDSGRRGQILSQAPIREDAFIKVKSVL